MTGSIKLFIGIAALSIVGGGIFWLGSEETDSGGEVGSSEHTRDRRLAKLRQAKSWDENSRSDQVAAPSNSGKSKVPLEGLPRAASGQRSAEKHRSDIQGSKRGSAAVYSSGTRQRPSGPARVPGRRRQRSTGGLTVGNEGRERSSAFTKGSQPQQRKRRIQERYDALPLPEGLEFIDDFDENADPNDPVLEISFEEDTTPEKGASAPIVDDVVDTIEGEGTVFDVNSQFAVPNAGNARSEAGTVSFFIKPEWGEDDKGDANLVQLSTPNVWENRLEIVKNGDYLRYMFIDDSGKEVGASIRINEWELGQEHLVAATWEEVEDGDNKIAFYVDGRKVGENSYPGSFKVPQNRPLYIGNSHRGLTGARSIISQFKVHGTALSLEGVNSLQ